MKRRKTMEAKNLIPESFQEYYDSVSLVQLAEYVECDVADIFSAENVQSYDLTHVAWGVIKDEYKEDISNEYEVVEFVSDGEETYPCEYCLGRVFNVAEEILKALQ
jgi:hypothetical protein